MQRDILFCGGFFFVIMFIFLLWCERHGSGSIVDVHELTWFFTTFVMLQFWNLFNAKCLGSSHSAFHHFWRDRGLILVLVLILLGQWLIVTFGDGMFRTVPLSLKEWIVIILCTSPVMIIGELWRWIQSMRKKSA
jgi:Ca2+-transporting ATPase